jgi:hypothetical protein
MTDPVVDARELLRGLHAYKVEYVLFGALAMIFYGYVRTTEDLDVAVNPDRENLDRVADWLISIDAMLKLKPTRRFGARERWRMHKGSNATVVTSMGQIDVVQRLPGLPELVSACRRGGAVRDRRGPGAGDQPAHADRSQATPGLESRPGRH